MRLSVPKKSGDKDGERALDIPLGEWALLRRWDQVLDTRRESGSLATIVDGAIRMLPQFAAVSIERGLDALKAGGYSARTHNHARNAAKAFARWLWERIGAK